MMRTHQQYSNGTHITSPAMGKQFSDGLRYLPHSKHHNFNGASSVKSANTANDNVFKVPPPVMPKTTKAVNCENSAPSFGGVVKNQTLAAKKAFGESTNSFHSQLNVALIE